ncbi:MAG: 30S ribosomal protein S7 [candidate division WS6 bacterium GW2011_GWF2_39_15]|uniref:Small ribosomal subunit protein uS7 n=1 Tax=candidate division WS6 bacterium GW2011_GWF2_39_15 TaxID=1619100 RepID=A0A0G0MN70_9BACT|nr:MAG: 30S ribosomal protein S7 [candidate division WS6 bacterium GW2011_GWF2_39_15]
MRGKQAKRKEQQRDVKFNSPLVARLISKVMQHGKKSTAQALVYSALDNASKKFKLESDKFLEEVVAKVKPTLEVRSRRVGGANYAVPVPVSTARQETLAIRWIVDYARKKGGQPFDKLLEAELVAAFNGEGDAMKKRADVEKMAEANKAFAHFRW